MSKQHIIATLLLVGLVFGTSLKATPPRYTSVHDTPVGISKTHLFLFRVLGDNEGSYFVSATRRYLVTQNIKTGKIEEIWPLDESRTTFVEPDGEHVVYHRVVPKIDPFDIMAAHSALPLMIDVPTDWSTGTIAISRPFKLAEIGIVDLRSDTIEVFAPADVVRQRVSASMTPFMDFLPDDLGPVDPMIFSGDAYTKDLEDCVLAPLWGNVPDQKVFWLACENGDFDVLGYSILLTFPDTE